MSTDEQRRAVIYLAYSAKASNQSVDGRKAVVAFSRHWKQLELFGAATSDVIFFIRPDEPDLLSTLKKLRVKHIVDIRDVPYLIFGQVDRTQFFDGLADLVVDYLGMHELMHKAGADSLEPLLTETDHSRPRSHERVEEVLSTRIEHGPTAVFCDEDPKRDDKVGALLEFLSRKQIKHSPVLATQTC